MSTHFRHKGYYLELNAKGYFETTAAGETISAPSLRAIKRKIDDALGTDESESKLIKFKTQFHHTYDCSQFLLITIPEKIRNKHNLEVLDTVEVTLRLIRKHKEPRL